MKDSSVSPCEDWLLLLVVAVLLVPAGSAISILRGGMVDLPQLDTGCARGLTVAFLSTAWNLGDGVLELAFWPRRTRWRFGAISSTSAEELELEPLSAEDRDPARPRLARLPRWDPMATGLAFTLLVENRVEGPPLFAASRTPVAAVATSSAAVAASKHATAVRARIFPRPDLALGLRFTHDVLGCALRFLSVKPRSL